MTVYELNRSQWIELKQNYLTRLSDEGIMNEVIYNKPDLDEAGVGVSYEELADADNLVDDDIIYNEYKDSVFSEDDFTSENEEE